MNWTLLKIPHHILRRGKPSQTVALIVAKSNDDPSQDSSIGSISAWYRVGPGFKSRQGREFFSEKKDIYGQNSVKIPPIQLMIEI